MKRFFILSAMLFFLLFPAGCNPPPKDAEGMDDILTEDISIPDGKILAIKHHLNTGWTHQDDGWFITSAGSVYAFNFSQDIKSKDFDTSQNDFYAKLNKIMEYSKPFFTLSEEELHRLYYYAQKVDHTETLSEDTLTSEAGSTRLYFYHEAVDNIIQVRQDEDYVGELQGEGARTLLGYCDSTLIPLIDDAGINNPDASVFLYTDADVHFYNEHCGYTDMEGRYLIQSEEDAQMLKELTSIDLFSYTWSDSYFPSDFFVYLVEFTNVPSTGYDLKANGIVVNNGSASFLESPDSQKPAPDEIVGAAMDGFCYIAELPTWAIPLSCYDSESDSYVLENWSTLE